MKYKYWKHNKGADEYDYPAEGVKHGQYIVKMPDASYLVLTPYQFYELFPEVRDHGEET